MLDKEVVLTSLEPVPFFKCLADDTRLMLVLLIHREGELCVCEMTHALALSQPKVSRHLAQLRGCGVLADRREGRWVHYRLEERLPAWASAILSSAADAQASRLDGLEGRLTGMGERPQRLAALC